MKTQETLFLALAVARGALTTVLRNESFGDLDDDTREAIRTAERNTRGANLASMHGISLPERWGLYLSAKEIEQITLGTSIA